MENIIEEFGNIQKLLSQLREDLKGECHNFAGEKIIYIQKELKTTVEKTVSLIEAMEDNIKAKQTIIELSSKNSDINFLLDYINQYDIAKPSLDKNKS